MTITKSARVPATVVIGAGIVGSCAAYHLLRLGAENVVLLDAGEPGGGSTVAGAGFVALWAAGAVPMGAAGRAFECYSLEFYREMATSGADIGYRSNGNLILALTAEGWAERPRAVLGDPNASPGTKALSPPEVAELTGVVDPSAVYGGVLMPSGIQVETEQAVGAVVRLVREMGGDVRGSSTVTGIGVAGRSIRTVATTGGDIEAGRVVVAAGGWTNSVLEHVGARLALLPVVATRIVTSGAGVPDTMPTMQCPEAHLWIRGTGGAFTWGTVPGYEPLYRFEAEEGVVPPGGRPASTRLLERVVATESGIARIFPTLAGAGVASFLQGMAVYTPDRNLMVGKVPGYDNAVVLAGDNESGVSHGPAMGRAGAELALGLTPFADLAGFAPDRFGPHEFVREADIEESLAAMRAPVFSSSSGVIAR